MHVERVTRIELALSAWEADVLPLNYTRERPPDYLAAAGARERPLLDHPVRRAWNVLRPVRMGKPDGAQRFVGARASLGAAVHGCSGARA